MQDIKIFKTSEKEFIITKNFVRMMIIVFALLILSILNVCGLDEEILSAMVKVTTLASTKKIVGIGVTAVIIAVIYALMNNKNKKKLLIRIGITAGVVLILGITPILGWIYLGLSKVLGLALKLHKIVVYIAWIFIIVTYFVQGSISGDLAEKKGYTKFVGALWGLIPLYGVIRFMIAPKRRNVQNSTVRGTYAGKEVAMKYLIFTELVVLAFIVVLPVIYLIGASLTNQSSLPTTFWPRRGYFTFDNYKYLFTDTEYPTWFKNTFIIAVINMVAGVLFITGAGYVFARFKFKGKKIGLIAILVLQVFPTFMGMVALFTLYETFGLVGYPTALSIIYIGGAIPGNLWLIKGSMSTIPRDLDESAMLDGANKLQIFTHIILPLSVPILSFVAVSMFMSPWMDYILPSYLLNILPKSKSHLISSTVSADDLIKQQWTIAVGLYNMISDAKNASYTTFSAGSIIIALPITVLYMIFQRFLIEGITAGATKG